jgi:hypothetical protein
MNHRIVRRISAVTITLAGLLLGCDKAATPPLARDIDHLSFTYTGAESGSFDATGNPQAATDGAIPRGDWATAFSYDASVSIPLAGTFSVLANDVAGAPYGNMLGLAKIPAQTGTFALSNSVGGLLYFDLTWTPSNFGSQHIYVVNSGAIRVDEYTGTHVRGSFSGTATPFDPPPGAPAPVITIANGQFDLAIDDPLVAPIRCELFSC